MLDDRPGRRHRAIALMAAVALALAVRQGFGPDMEARGQANLGPDSRPSGPGQYDLSIRAAGHRWSYTVYVPPGVDGRSPRPLVVALHGSGSSGAAFLNGAGWASRADRDGFIVVAPDALPMRPGMMPWFPLNPRLWNSGQHPDDRDRTQIDDLAFLDAMLEAVARRWPIDPARVYAAGHSNGGAMALRLAAERSDRIAAVASVAGLCHVERPRPSRGVPTMMILGGHDPILPTDGGVSVLPWEVRRTRPVADAVAAWARAIGCEPRPDRVEHDGPIHYFRYAPTPGGDRVEMTGILIDGHGHSWPGGRPILPPPLSRNRTGTGTGTGGHAVDATALIWGFFERHPMLPDTRS